jgi:hypothetical protein
MAAGRLTARQGGERGLTRINATAAADRHADSTSIKETNDAQRRHD